jgi:hypothetical protein
MWNIATKGYNIHKTPSTKLGANGLNLFLDWHSVCNKQNVASYGSYLLKYRVDAGRMLVLDTDWSNQLLKRDLIQQLDHLQIKADPALDLKSYQKALSRSGPQNVLATMAIVYILRYRDNADKISGIVCRTTYSQPFCCVYGLNSANVIEFAQTTVDDPDGMAGIPYTATSPNSVNWIRLKGSKPLEAVASVETIRSMGHTIPVFRNPSPDVLLNAAKRKTMRGLVDSQTGDTYWWPASMTIHVGAASALGLSKDCYEPSGNARLEMHGNILKIISGIKTAIKSASLRYLSKDIGIKYGSYIGDFDGCIDSVGFDEK